MSVPGRSYPDRSARYPREACFFKHLTILLLQRLQLAGIGYSHVAELRAPVVQGRIAEASLAWFEEHRPDKGKKK